MSLLNLICADAPESEMMERFADSSFSTREPMRRGDQTIGWQQNVRFADEGNARLRRIEPGGQFRGTIVEYSRSNRPLLLLRSDNTCQVQIARAINYDERDQALSIEELSSELESTGRAQPLNPPLPRGVVSPGIRVALVDSGVNYQLNVIADRLARDQNGALVGFDFWDMDSRPFDSHPVRSPFFPQRHGTRIASLILREAGEIQLVPYRYPRPDMSRMRDLLQHAEDAGVRIVNMSLGGNRSDQWETFNQVARDLPNLLFVVSAGNNGRDIDVSPVYPAALELENMITVTSSDRRGHPHVVPTGASDTSICWCRARRFQSLDSTAAPQMHQGRVTPLRE